MDKTDLKSLERFCKMVKENAKIINAYYDICNHSTFFAKIEYKGFCYEFAIPIIGTADLNLVAKSYADAYQSRTDKSKRIICISFMKKTEIILN